MHTEIITAEIALAPAVKESIEMSFSGFFAKARDIQTNAENVTDPKAAREYRLELKKLRGKVEATHKELKADSLLVGRAIDGAKNLFLAMATPVERQLEEIEKAEERREAARIDALRMEREAALADIPWPSFGVELGTMSDEVWLDYLQQSKDAAAAKQARMEASRLEAERQKAVEAAAVEAQRLENLRLREEAEANRAAKAVADRQIKLAQEYAKQEQDKIKAEAEAAKQELRRLEDIEKKRVAKELHDAAIEAARVAKAAAAPDKEKLSVFIGAVRSLELPSVSNEAAMAIRKDIDAKRESFAKWVEAQIATL